MAMEKAVIVRDKCSCAVDLTAERKTDIFLRQEILINLKQGIEGNN
jgi:hypothetical protein